jgi:hypothetical protein
MRKRLLPLDLVALILLALAMLFPWPVGLRDFNGWAVRAVLTMLSIVTMVAHFVLNAALFNKLTRYFRLALDTLVFVTAIFWQLNLLIGLQGMS